MKTLITFKMKVGTTYKVLTDGEKFFTQINNGMPVKWNSKIEAFYAALAGLEINGINNFNEV